MESGAENATGISTESQIRWDSMTIRWRERENGTRKICRIWTIYRSIDLIRTCFLWVLFTLNLHHPRFPASDGYAWFTLNALYLSRLCSVPLWVGVRRIITLHSNEDIRVFARERRQKMLEGECVNCLWILENISTIKRHWQWGEGGFGKSRDAYLSLNTNLIMVVIVVIIVRLE